MNIFNEFFYVIGDDFFIIDFNNPSRQSWDSCFQKIFDFSESLYRKSVDDYLDNGELPISVDHMITKFIPNSNLEDLQTPIKKEGYKDDDIKKLLYCIHKYYYATKELILLSEDVKYKNEFHFDYDLAIHAIKINANGFAIFLFINFIEKFFKSILVDKFRYSDTELKKIGHNVKKLWKEIDNKITKKETFNNVLFNKKITHLWSFYSADLRYKNKKYDIRKSIEVNILTLDIVDYILSNTIHDFKEIDSEEFYKTINNI